jgi:hypothetical protein
LPVWAQSPSDDESTWDPTVLITMDGNESEVTEEIDLHKAYELLSEQGEAIGLDDWDEAVLNG